MTDTRVLNYDNVLDHVANIAFDAEYVDVSCPIAGDIHQDHLVFTASDMYDTESDEKHHDCTAQSHVTSAETITEKVVNMQACRATPKHKEPFNPAAYNKAYRARPGWKEKHAAYMKAYRATPEYKVKKKESNRAYRANPEFKEKQAAYNKAYRARPDYRAKRAAYCANPDYKARRVAYDKARRATPEYIERRAAYDKARRAAYKTECRAVRSS